MKLNNKGFAITGVLYTVFILFLLIITSVLAGLQLKRTMLERSVLTLEDSYIGENLYESEAGKDIIKKINEKSESNTGKVAPVTGKYIFNIRNNFYLGENSVDFPYTGTVQTFTAEKKGYYKLETWGAKGGSAGPNSGGKGGYSSGLLFMDPTSETGIKELYVVVGGRGNSLSNASGTASGGYNGGGDAGGKFNKIVGSGGGATHIAITSGELSSLSSANVLIVAGGGGGSAYEDASYYGFGGAGGGKNGNSGLGSVTLTGANVGSGGTDVAGGTQKDSQSPDDTSGGFGKGGKSPADGTGGGGGYYGGGAGNWFAGGGGGSGFVSTELINGTTIAGSQNIPEYPKQDEGNGHARITYYGEDAADLTGLTSLYGYTGTAQEFTVLEDGKYKIELWGAQGGSYDSTYVGGKGGYTSGYINLDKAKEEKLYVYVGGRGSMTSNAINQTSPGGYNGGGDGYNNQSAPDRYAGSGGGATDIRLKNEKWDNPISLNSRIMVAAGGGGSWYHSVEFNGIGGFGGGIIGGAGTGKCWGTNCSIDGANQFPRDEYSDVSYEAGTFGKGASRIGEEHPGAGGGYYGGNNRYYMSSGGSSYISGHKGCVAIQGETNSAPQKNCTNDIECSKHYSGKFFENTKMCDGNDELMPSPVDVNFMTGNSGDGYAKITYMGNGDVKVNDITCMAYLTKGTPIDLNNINFLTSDCNEAKKNSLFAFKASEKDYNVITLAAIYSFER